MVAVAATAAVVGGGIYSAQQQKGAAKSASQAQTAANQSAMAQQQAQFEETKKLLAPYVQAGNNALGQQGNLIGLGGNAAQQQAIDQLKASPFFTSQLQAGQNAILQNASATGGLRGGNTQAALAQFAPQLLAQTIQNQFGNLGSLTSIGQNSAVGTGNAGQMNANNQAGMLQNIGNAQAGYQVSKGAANAGMANSLISAIGGFGQLGGFGGMGGSAPTSFTGGAGLGNTGMYIPSTY